jgi:hypothetical protein
MRQLSESALKQLKFILDDTNLKRALLNIPDNQKLAKTLIVHTDGSVDIGKTKSGFWNNLLGGTTTLSFEEVSMRIIKQLAGQGACKNELALSEMAKEWALSNNGIFAGNYNPDEIVDMLFAFYNYGNKTGFFNNPQAFERWIGEKSNVNSQSAAVIGIEDPLSGRRIGIPVIIPGHTYTVL